MPKETKKGSSYRALQQKSNTNLEAKNSKEPTVAPNALVNREKTPQNLQIEIVNDIDGCKTWIPKLKSYVLFVQSYKIILRRY